MAAYTINIPDDRIAALKQKLSHATFPDELEGTGNEYGAPLAEVKRLTEYWKTSYDWKAAEAKLNALPNFHKSIKVDGFPALDIHYLHQPSDSPDAIPLLFCHGWPGSYIEVTKMLESLKQSIDGVSFHVVAPSLPNFAWSEGPKQRAFGLKQYAEVNHRLMHSLGYPKYVTQGGDWGFYITRAMGLLYPQSVMASHINMIRASPPTWSSHPLLALQHAVQPYSEREKKGFERSKWFNEEGNGYRVLQCTKPQTVGYALADSPVGLLAWMLEKLVDWTNNYPWTDDDLLTWISIYHFSTAGPAASLRIYYEAVHSELGGVSRDRTQQWIGGVKLGLCHSPRELTVVPSTWARTLGPVVFESFKEKGGHFAAWEVPEEIVGDLRGMFGRGGKCYGITGPVAKL
ncbi:hypothetical protein LTR35_002569 [Friedmanniomyces endolithicus]|uniref:Epoxide hydrolase N-terminal domain-containing protein n=1 Tax=Friedmanniomyces endolithicus TaxID=329885 RepID=A0AAN6FWC3_9PEZI|nr:hypothetical protein LTR35_002569 [Friedmanniomyces endolithicus]KAK0291450.1 hypothetical protein LTS00_008450 [Friedmanniomyces endolithicus]KAK0323519.1 hypothetical protein LTR82_005266 [Friedmanniomyces endolithicus]KAK1019926.1 hypothetical protein LTR54_000570 [Friedmanniomyces endolithicus]